jgi:hypothetical protein
VFAIQNALKQKSTIKMMIWGDDAEVKVLQSQNKVCSAMTDDERTKCKFTADSKREIAETA